MLQIKQANNNSSLNYQNITKSTSIFLINRMYSTSNNNSTDKTLDKGFHAIDQAASKVMQASMTQKQENNVKNANDGDKKEEKGKVKESIYSMDGAIKAFKKYGTLGLGFHSAVFCATMGGFFGLLHVGVDIHKIFELFGLNPGVIPTEGSAIAVAWGLTILTGPVRLGLDAVAIPFIAKRFGSLSNSGISTSKPQLSSPSSTVTKDGSNKESKPTLNVENSAKKP